MTTDRSPGGRWLLGLGARPSVQKKDLDQAVDLALHAAGLTTTDIAALATLDRRADHPAIQALAAARGWPIHAYPATDLATVPVPNPSPRAATATGTPSVAEAAALKAAGPNAVLILPKQTHQSVTTAIAQAEPPP